jgi:hypothetical protein
MAVKTFQDVFDEIRAEITVSNRSGKPVKSWSKSAFDKLAKALINDPDYTIHSVAIKNGEVEDREVRVVEKYRNVIRGILQEFGVDKQEAARVLTSDFEFRSVEGLYELASELIFQYIAAGKKFDFIQRKDFTGSLALRDVEEAVTEHKSIRKDGVAGQIFKVKKAKHRQLEKKSKAPRWLKTRLK